MIATLKKYTNHSLFKFSIVGVMNTLLDLIVFFFIFITLGWGLVTANVTSFFFINLLSYLLNKHWSFKSKSDNVFSIKQYFHFVSASLFSLIIGTGILVLGSYWFSVVALKFVSILVTPLINYLIYKYVIFKK